MSESPEKYGAGASTPPSDEELAPMLQLVEADLDPERAKSLLMRLVLQAQLPAHAAARACSLPRPGRGIFRLEDWASGPEPKRHAYEALKAIAS